MRALPWSCCNGIPASRQAEGSAAGHRSEIYRYYSRTGRARCTRSTRIRPAARHSGIRDETADASRSINANASPAMGGTDVTAETRLRVVSDRTRSTAEMLKVKPVVLAHEHDSVNENLRCCHERDDNTNTMRGKAVLLRRHIQEAPYT